MDGRTDDLPKLDTMSVEYQQQLLVREILLVFAGFEGQYIRLAASSTTASGLPTSVHGIHGEKGHGYASETGFSMYDDVMQGTATNSYYNSLYGNNPKGPAIIPKLAQVKFLIDIDSADKSTASQVIPFSN